MPTPPPPGPLPEPDPRCRDLASDYAGRQVLVADLVLPGDAPMEVLSALETSRELIRHSYFRYEFATVAVAHSPGALERVLAERIDVDRPWDDLISLAVGADLIPPALAAELDRCRRLRERLAHGAVTSAALGPVRAAALLRAVFDAVAHLLCRPVPADLGGARDPLAEQWHAHLHTPFPPSFRGVDVGGVELVLLDADVAGLVRRELDDGLDADGVARLWACLADLDKVLPLLHEAYCAAYFTNLRALARRAAGRHLPVATRVHSRPENGWVPDRLTVAGRPALRGWRGRGPGRPRRGRRGRCGARAW